LARPQKFVDVASDVPSCSVGLSGKVDGIHAGFVEESYDGMPVDTPSLSQFNDRDESFADKIEFLCLHVTFHHAFPSLPPSQLEPHWIAAMSHDHQD